MLEQILALISTLLWPGGIFVRVLACDTKGCGCDSRPFHFQIKIGQVVHTHLPLSPSSIGAVMPCVWEGNRRSGVALAMYHRLKWFVHL